MPMPAENNAATTIEINETSTAHLAIAEINQEVISPNRMPMTPPIEASTNASMMNWRFTSASVAPTAMRIPISRVRSVTDTSMMFMMPMPPTSSETLAMEPSRMVMMP